MRLSRLTGLALVIGFQTLHAATPATPTVQIEHSSFTLDNGLTVLVHSDHSVPIVGVNIWYKVGSRDERPGRTGFAHLFEHFFFNGSENYPHGFREAMDDLGANNRNGTTNTDRTNFFEDVPVSALERTLYLEADRMGFLAGNISAEMLERERGVVKNEKRQGQNQPYGGVYSRMVEAIYPAGHPYSWSTIGRMEDLDAATLDDIREWYSTYYGPGNAVLALAGDITPERAKELAVRYFGPIKPGVPLSRLDQAQPRLDAIIRDRMEDRVPQTRIYMAWHLPPLGDQDVYALELLASVLGDSDSARLDRALRFERELATDVGALVWGKQLTSTFLIQASLRPGQNASELQQGLLYSLNTVIEQGPRADELERARSRLLARFARGIERLGGFGGRSDVLAEGAALLGDSNAYQQRLRALQTLNAKQVQDAARRWLQQPYYQLQVDPFVERQASAESIDRSQLPALGAAPAVAFPEVQSATLDNGLKVLLMQRKNAPLVQLTLAVDAGAAADPDSAPGTAQLTMDSLLLGTRANDVFALADRRDALGTTLEVRTTLDLSLLEMQALRAKLGDSLQLLADVVREPAFPEPMLAIQRKQQLAAIAQQKASPVGAALRLAPPLLYGPSHVYGKPWGSLGRAEVVETLSRQALVEWHAKWFVPGNASLIVAGDIEMEQLLSMLRPSLGRWPQGALPDKQIAVPEAQPAGRVYLLDKPGAPQSVLVAAHLSLAGGDANDLALESVMRNFGGMATSRLNRNLRLDKHWSYGASGSVSNARGPRPFLVIAPVQTDKTAEAMQELRAEIRGVAGERPLQGEEFESIMRSQLSRLPARFETLADLSSAAVDMLAVGRAPDYYYDYARNLRQLQAQDLNAAATAAVQPEQLIWIVIGDLSKVESAVRALDYGEVLRLDSSAL